MTVHSRVGLYAAFAGLGGTAAIVPALIPSFGARLGSTELGVVPALFTGVLIGVLLSAPLLTLFRARSVTAIGSGVQAACLVTLTFAASANFVILTVAITGIGFGLTEAAGSVAAKRMAAGSATRSLTSLTGTVALVAAVSPILVAVTAGGAVSVPVFVAALQLVAAVMMLLTHEDPPKQQAAAHSSAPSGHSSRRTMRVFIVASSALVLYVGVETVFSGWSAVIPGALLNLDAQTAALGTSAFWICMAIGRFVTSSILRHGNEPGVLLVACTAIAVLGLSGATMLPQSALSLCALAVSVVAMAPVYSLILGQALDRLTPQAAARAAGPLVATGAVGGSLVPTIVLLSGLQPESSGTFAAAAAICFIIWVGATGLLVSGRAARTERGTTRARDDDRPERAGTPSEPASTHQESSTP